MLFNVHTPYTSVFYTHPTDLKTLAQNAADEQKLMHQNARALLAPLCAQWQGNFQALAAGGEGALLRGALAKKCLSALRELLHIVPNWQGIESDMRAFLEAIHAASMAIMPTLNAGMLWGWCGGGACSWCVAIIIVGTIHNIQHPHPCKQRWERMMYPTPPSP